MLVNFLTYSKKRQTMINNNSLIESISKDMFDSDLTSTRLTLAFAEILWAIMLFWPGETFDRPTYLAMARIMSETSWGFVFLISAFLQTKIVVLSQQNRDWAKVFANWNAVLWVTVVGSALFSVYPPPAAMAGEITLACAAVWIWLRPSLLDRAAIKYLEEGRTECPILREGHNARK